MSSPFLSPQPIILRVERHCHAGVPATSVQVPRRRRTVRDLREEPPKPGDRGRLGFLRGRARPAVEAFAAFIDGHRQVSGAEPVRKVLAGYGLKIATSTYCAAEKRRSSPRSVRDTEPKTRSRRREAEDAKPKTRIGRVHADDVGAHGVRKIRRQPHREGIPVARRTVARLMRDLGLQSVRRGRSGPNARPAGSAGHPAQKIRSVEGDASELPAWAALKCPRGKGLPGSEPRLPHQVAGRFRFAESGR
ncbi:IS3 family transposase [Streptomyces sp. NPDC088766]|uniref:IS3 family transposase n=1 Tax=Streptomyces sp. NPDC088766 TaxID=3365893 RepID=UPI003821CFA6